MNRPTEQKVGEYLQSQNLLTLATVSKDGNPLAHTVNYASEGATVYFCTNKNTRKAQNIINNPSVAYTVDAERENWSEIRAVQMEGRAGILTEKPEIEKAGAILMGKFPQLANMPPDPDFVFVKIEPVRAIYIDNTVNWGYRETVQFE